MTSKIVACVVAGLLVLSPVMAEAQYQNCAPREIVVKRLAEKYGESRKAIGMGQQNMIMETYASDETGTWTIVIVTPNGMSCLVASGQSFELLNETLPEGDPT